MNLNKRLRVVSTKVPNWMLTALNAEADERGMSLSQMVADMLTRRLHEIDPEAEAKHSKMLAPF